ncbi:MAG: histidine kinase dimerization/phospho-acceptor domain-containing protein [Candidatus Rokuibacteriota bacterium]
MIGVGGREIVFERLADLEATVGRLSGLSDQARADLAGRVAALRASLEEEREAGREERHRLSHDLRVPLNAIAGWTHILRLDAATAATVDRAADVLDRNVRALTRLIEAYTAAGDR